MAEKKLRAVAPNEKPHPKAPATIKAAVEGDERALLVAMRKKIAAEIDGGVPPHTLAPLMRQLRELDKEIRSLDVRDKEESNDHRGSTEDTSEAFDASAV